MTCSHGWEKPIPSSECDPDIKERCFLQCNSKDYIYSELDVFTEAPDGPVRLRWLSALLKIADEVDNQVKRSVPGHLSSQLSWRRNVRSIVFDQVGKCVKLCIPSLSRYWKDTDYKYLHEAIQKINLVLENWKEPLEEMEFILLTSICRCVFTYSCLIFCG